ACFTTQSVRLTATLSVAHTGHLRCRSPELIRRVSSLAPASAGRPERVRSASPRAFTNPLACCEKSRHMRTVILDQKACPMYSIGSQEELRFTGALIRVR